MNYPAYIKFTTIGDVKIPMYSSDGAAGIDFFVPNYVSPIKLKPHKQIRIASNVMVSIPQGFALVAFNKSGIALKGLQVGACVVDSDYQGEISLHVFNYSDQIIEILPGQKLVQFILLPVSIPFLKQVDKDDLYEEPTVRLGKGFGSTGLM